jgi:hypothetical protein
MAKANKPKLGFSEKPTAHLVAAREKVYGEFFGGPFTVNHELLPLVPHIDVYVFEPNEELERDYWRSGRAALESADHGDRMRIHPAAGRQRVSRSAGKEAAPDRSERATQIVPQTQRRVTSCAVLLMGSGCQVPRAGD